MKLFQLELAWNFFGIIKAIPAVYIYILIQSVLIESSCIRHLVIFFKNCVVFVSEILQCRNWASVLFCFFWFSCTLATPSHPSIISSILPRARSKTSVFILPFPMRMNSFWAFMALPVQCSQMTSHFCGPKKAFDSTNHSKGMKLLIPPFFIHTRRRTGTAPQHSAIITFVGCFFAIW